MKKKKQNKTKKTFYTRLVSVQNRTIGFTCDPMGPRSPCAPLGPGPPRAPWAPSFPARPGNPLAPCRINSTWSLEVIRRTWIQMHSSDIWAAAESSWLKRFSCRPKPAFCVPLNIVTNINLSKNVNQVLSGRHSLVRVSTSFPLSCSLVTYDSTLSQGERRDSKTHRSNNNYTARVVHWFVRHP